VKKQRLIPVLLLKNGWLVLSRRFQRHQNIGNPIAAVKRLSEWASDELIYIDISRDDSYDLRRDDLAHPNRSTFLQIIEDVARVSFMPITVGGRIRSLEDIERRLAVGADKIAINTRPIEEPQFISESAREFGSQCIVVSIDVKLVDGRHVVMSHNGQRDTGMAPLDWARRCADLGAGEILLNSIDRDGARNGYDIELLDAVSRGVGIPVIALGGVGDWTHFAEALERTAVDAVAAANIFNYTDQSVYLAKKHLYTHQFNVRPPDLELVDKGQPT
jgi:cyclase